MTLIISFILKHIWPSDIFVRSPQTCDMSLKSIDLHLEFIPGQTSLALSAPYDIKSI